MGQLVRDVYVEPLVLCEVLSEVVFVEPVRLPVVDVTHAHGLWMNLLSHSSLADRFSLVLLVVRVRAERDRQVARALANRRRAAHRARPKALDRRPLVS